MFLQCPEKKTDAVPYAIDPENTINVLSWQDCSYLCQKRIGCKYWTFNKGANICVTMTDATNAIMTKWKISGSGQCVGKGSGNLSWIDLLLTNFDTEHGSCWGGACCPGARYFIISSPESLNPFSDVSDYIGCFNYDSSIHFNLHKVI